MSKRIFLSHNNKSSGRWAVFEDDGVSGWLYLTNPNDQKPIADCWIYNRIQAIEPAEILEYRNGPPPASSEYACLGALIFDVVEKDIQIRWSDDGNAVSLLINEIPMGYISADGMSTVNRTEIIRS